ncbi:MAG: penicillin-binding transpeptidase domain-containing protein [Lachnospiraceae bacterium]|nr:penicillin-binding transpeptidase domain-containing protein [Ruminococcus sp.]MCM1275943.1 penicillin-binding transpeptidase domain-containing protein [Lachnospiraceae bacterium]
MNKNTKSGRGLFWRFVDFVKRKDAAEADKKPLIGYRGRQMVILSLVVGFSAFVGYNLLKFTVLDGDMWRQRANSQQMETLKIMANRGTIYDTNGTVLAQSSTVWNIIIAPTPIYEANEERRKAYSEKLANKKDDETVAPFRELSEIISTELSEILGVKPDGMLEACKDHEEQYYYVVKRSVEKPEVTLIQQMMIDNNIRADCIVAEQSSKRYYPNGSLASNVIGFTNFDGYGVYGLEAYYDDYLRGTDGKAFYRKDGLGQGVDYENDSIHQAVDGYSLVLTLDEVLQHYLEKNLEQAVSQHSVINRACGIIMNCKTGGVLAMATTPSYDLNNPSEITSQYDLDLLEQMKEEGKSEDEIAAQEGILREQQWKNKAVTELYYPGSVFKTVTASSALEEEVINPETSSFNCPGYADVAGTKISCWREWGHGTLTLQEAMTASCNPSFIAIGQALGMQKFCSYFEAFGFTEPTGIDLPGEAQSLYVPYSRMNLVDLAMSSMGQTNKITPIQMCTAFCAIVNGGNLVTPHLVDKILDSNGNVVETKETQIKRQVISAETSETMRGILETIVTENGGHNAYIAGYRIGGKSGTAEKIDEYNAAGGMAGGAQMTYIGTFAAAVPMDDPQIVMLVLVDTPTGPEYYGSAVACPVVSAVFKDGLEHLGIYPTYTAEEQAKMDAIVPNVKGDLSMYAQSYLTANNFEVRWVGDPSGEARVTDQVPASGSSIPKGSTVVLYIGDEELETGTVPNVLGMSVSAANEAITDAGFNIKILGGAAENADAVATMQNYSEGQTLYKGSVIEVTFQANSFGD